jgi:hypothetical protein
VVNGVNEVGIVLIDADCDCDTIDPDGDGRVGVGVTDTCDWPAAAAAAVGGNGDAGCLVHSASSWAFSSYGSDIVLFRVMVHMT